VQLAEKVSVAEQFGDFSPQFGGMTDDWEEVMRPEGITHLTDNDERLMIPPCNRRTEGCR